MTKKTKTKPEPIGQELADGYNGEMAKRHAAACTAYKAADLPFSEYPNELTAAQRHELAKQLTQDYTRVRAVLVVQNGHQKMLVEPIEPAPVTAATLKLPDAGWPSIEVIRAYVQGYQRGLKNLTSVERARDDYKQRADSAEKKLRELMPPGIFFGAPPFMDPRYPRY